jgi:hypothetical protein
MTNWKWNHKRVGLDITLSKTLLFTRFEIPFLCFKESTINPWMPNKQKMVFKNIQTEITRKCFPKKFQFFFLVN